MKLIVGLGNPGKEYTNTRHNIGFRFIDFYLSYSGISDKWCNKFDGLYLQTTLFAEKVIFLKPQTYMNLSGNSVRKLMDYYNISIEDILVVSDDLDLMVGNYKLRPSGSSGGHNGLKSIESSIASTSYKRLKIGISNDKDMDTKDYVLGTISKSDNLIYEKVFQELCLVLDDYFHLPFSSFSSFSFSSFFLFSSSISFFSSSFCLFY